MGPVSTYIRCYFAILHEIRFEEIHEKLSIFGPKLLIFDSFGLSNPPELLKVPLLVILKYSPQETDDFRFLQIENIQVLKITECSVTSKG